jgi:hypothetical protein
VYVQVLRSAVSLLRTGLRQVLAQSLIEVTFLKHWHVELPAHDPVQVPVGHRASPQK